MQLCFEVHRYAPELNKVRLKNPRNNTWHAFNLPHIDTRKLSTLNQNTDMIRFVRSQNTPNLNRKGYRLTFTYPNGEKVYKSGLCSPQLLVTCVRMFKKRYNLAKLTNVQSYFI